MTIRITQMSAALGAVLVAGSTFAQTPWGVPATPTGSGTFFDYFQGHNSNTNLYGSPTLIGGNTFAFFPSNFEAGSVGTNADSATDQFNVQLVAHANQFFSQIQIQEFGDWSIIGVGSVQDTGTVFLTDLLNIRAPIIQSMQFSPSMPINTPGSNVPWSGNAVIDFTQIPGPHWTNVMLQFTNTLQASSSGASSVANIRKSLVNGPSIVVNTVPAPGAGALLAAGGLVLSRRRRR